MISDLPAGHKRLSDSRLRWRGESTFQALTSRGWNWEESHVRRLDHVDRMLLVLFLGVWWVTHLAACCIHHGRRDRYDRHDRRAKGIFRSGRLYLLDFERRALRSCDLQKWLPFQHSADGWLFALRF